MRVKEHLIFVSEDCKYTECTIENKTIYTRSVITNWAKDGKDRDIISFDINDPTACAAVAAILIDRDGGYCIDERGNSE